MLLTSLRVSAQFEEASDENVFHLFQSVQTTIGRSRIALGLELMGRRPADYRFTDSVQDILVAEVEATRDRELMCAVYSGIAAYLLNYNQLVNHFQKWKSCTDRCLKIATESNLDEYKAASFMLYALYYNQVFNQQKALDFNNQAISLATALGSDSLLSVAYQSIARTYRKMSNKISEFQALLNRQDLALKSHIEILIADSYFDLGEFYLDNNDYEKAKDNYSDCIQNASKWGKWHKVYESLRGLAQCYIAQGNDKLGMSYYSKAFHLGDSLGIEVMRVGNYLDIVNYYFNSPNSTGGMDYLNAHPQLVKFIEDLGVAFQLNKLRAVEQTRRNHYDSAMYYLNQSATAEYGLENNFTEKFYFTMQRAQVLKLMKKYPDQREILLKAKSFADSAQDLNYQKYVYQELDSVYVRLNDYKNAQTYLSMYNATKDSLESLSKQKELTNIEIESANKRALEKQKEERVAMRARNNLEYMGITMVLAILFIILVALGVFKMSPAVIKALGFFVFIFLFEFIVLLLDTQIHEFTDEEPWKVLGIKIIIIALLLPLHHWLEEKMTRYLTSKAHMLKARFLGKRQAFKSDN